MPCNEGFRMSLSHLIYTVLPCLIHTCHTAPMPSPTMPLFSRTRHSTVVERLLARFRLLPATTRSSTKFYQTHTNLRRRWPVWNQTPFATHEEKSGSSTLQKRLIRTSSSDISGYHADVHEGHGTVGAWQGRGMSCVNYRTAWARHGNGMSAACYVWIGL